MKEEYLEKVRYLLFLDHPVSIRDIATLTFSSEEDVLHALEQLRSCGLNIWSDGELAEIRGK